MMMMMMMIFFEQKNHTFYFKCLLTRKSRLRICSKASLNRQTVQIIVQHRIAKMKDCDRDTKTRILKLSLVLNLQNNITALLLK